MIGIDNEKILSAIVVFIVIAAAAFAGYTVVHANTPVRIGVLLPLTGDIELKEPMEWATENINRHGGISGRPVELVYRDTTQGDTVALAREFLADDSVRIVIGPPTSDDVYLLAPEFEEKKKLLLSPLTTSGDLIRAFGKKGYFWRTAQGDAAQVKVILSTLRSKDVQRIALLAENTTYGKTFWDWTGFFATEYGIEVVTIRQFGEGSASLEDAVQEALASDPEYIILAGQGSDAAIVKQAIDRSNKPVRLFLTDAGGTPELLRLLGDDAEGIEGVSPTADPSTGFAVAYRERFGHAPADYAAPAYDAILLAAYATARQESSFFESPADSMRRVVNGNGTPAGWDAQGVREAIAAIRAGREPAISGASGPLDFDPEYGTDPLVTYYSSWTVEEGTFLSNAVTGSAKAGTATRSAGLSRASAALMTIAEGGPSSVPAAGRTGFSAVVVGSSRGWNNYRHQSDALAVYSLLRRNGVPDDRIVLMLYDDVPVSPQNPLRGDVHNIPKGENLRAPASVDYSGKDVSPRTLIDVLTGNRSETIPVVLESDEGTDIFVYIAGHGSPGSIAFPYSSELTADDFTQLTTQMEREGRYRQIVYMVDSCFGESMAVNVTPRDMLYFTGASASETSLGAVYDTDIRQWLSNEFTKSALAAMNKNQNITFRELYITSYEMVTGSHVRLRNAEHFRSIDMPVQEFLRP